MIKWLIITLVVITVFMTILLGLGYLLSENEKSSTELKNQLEHEAFAKQEEVKQRRNLSHYSQDLSVDGSVNSIAQATEKLALQSTSTEIIDRFEKTLINNLTCVSIAQCQVITVKFKNINCQLASNIIGVSQLKKIATNAVNLSTCPFISEQSQLACKQNICTLISTNE